MGPLGPAYIGRAAILATAILVAPLLGIRTHPRAKPRPTPPLGGRFGLAILALALGPLVGAGLALPVVTCACVRPADLGLMLERLSGLGLHVGMILGLARVVSISFASPTTRDGRVKPKRDDLDWD